MEKPVVSFKIISQNLSRRPADMERSYEYIDRAFATANNVWSFSLVEATV